MIKRAFMTLAITGTLINITSLPASSEESKDTSTQASSSSVMKLPEGWIKAGSNPGDYDMGIDESVKHQGTKCGCMKSNKDKIEGFGTLMQMFKADKYKGMRLRLTGYTKTEDVGGWAGMWMRVDGPKGSRSLSFDNMQDRPIKGNTDWTKQTIVLKVPEESTFIAFGVLLDGTGKVWMDDFQFEEVGDEVALTGGSGGSVRTTKPVNLNFEGEK